MEQNERDRLLKENLEIKSKYYACRDLLAYCSGYCKADLPELAKKIEEFLYPDKN